MVRKRAAFIHWLINSFFPDFVVGLLLICIGGAGWFFWGLYGWSRRVENDISSIANQSASFPAAVDDLKKIILYQNDKIERIADTVATHGDRIGRVEGQLSK